MLLTETNLSRRNNLIMPQPERRKKVKRSMAAIKTVLGERKRAKIAAFRAMKTAEAQEGIEGKMEDEAESMEDIRLEGDGEEEGADEDMDTNDHTKK